MNRSKKVLFNLALGIVACILVSLPTLAMNKSPQTLAPSQSQAMSSEQAVESVSAQFDDTIAAQIERDLREAEAVLMAQAEPQAEPAASPTTSPATISLTRYVAVMTGSNVVPNPASTSAFGAAGAVLSGNRLIVRGDFSNLTSPLRDYATDPVNPPNPNITSGVHIHKGEPTQNGPFQAALQVQLRDDQRSGRVQGDLTLTDEQLQALSNGTMYVDLHTKQNRAGELRGILRSY